MCSVVAFVSMWKFLFLLLLRRLPKELEIFERERERAIKDDYTVYIHICVVSSRKRKNSDGYVDGDESNNNPTREIVFSFRLVCSSCDC